MGIMIVLVGIFYIIYLIMVNVFLITGDVYTTKKGYLEDLIVPFYGIYRIMKNEFKKLK